MTPGEKEEHRLQERILVRDYGAKKKRVNPKKVASHQHQLHIELVKP
jgi:hypothetical protein